MSWGRTPLHGAVYYCKVITIKGKLLALMYLALSSWRQAIVTFFLVWLAVLCSYQMSQQQNISYSLRFFSNTIYRYVEWLVDRWLLKVFFFKPLMIWFRRGDTALTRYRGLDIFIYNLMGLTLHHNGLCEWSHSCDRRYSYNTESVEKKKEIRPGNFGFVGSIFS